MAMRHPQQQQTCLHGTMQAIRTLLEQRDRGELKAVPEGARKQASKVLREASQAEVAAWRSVIDVIVQERLVRAQEARVFVAQSAVLPDKDRKVCLAGVHGAKGVKKNVKMLGSGAFGEVYAVDGRAVKVASLMPRWYTLEQVLENWAVEVKFARVCGSIGVGPKIHDAFICEHGQTRYGVIVMDMIKNGVTLYDWRKTASEAGVKAAEELLQKRLAKMHAKGVFHGDLHSENVMVVPADKDKKAVKDLLIVDYGFARSLSAMQKDDQNRIAWVADASERVVEDILLHLVSGRVIQIRCQNLVCRTHVA